MSEVTVGSWTAAKCVIGEFLKVYFQWMVDVREIKDRNALIQQCNAITDVAVSNGDMTAAECECICSFVQKDIRFLPDDFVQTKCKLNKFIEHVQCGIVSSMVDDRSNIIIPESLVGTEDVFKRFMEAKDAFDAAKAELSGVLRPAVVKRLKEFVLKYQSLMDKAVVNIVNVME